MAIEVLSGSNYREPVVKNEDYKQFEANIIQNEHISINSNMVNRAGSAKMTDEEGTKGQEGNGQIYDNQVKNAVARANNKMKAHRTQIEFSYHDETNRVSIKVFDKETKEVIREIPPEEALEMIEKMWELAGLIIDEKR